MIFDFLAWTTKRISRKKGCDAIRGADRALYASGVRGGVPTIVFDAATASIHCTIRYESASSLSEHEREVLRGFSNGQLVDGFGSNPIDVPSLGDGDFVHLGDE